MARVAPGQSVVLKLKYPKGEEDEIVILAGDPDRVQDEVGRMRLEAAINKHDSHNERASPKRYGNARCLTCKKKIVRRSYNECRKCRRYVCPDCRQGLHDVMNHTARAML
jgi:hypothetical protein